VGRDGFDLQMGNALKAIGTFLGASRSYVFLDGADGSTTSAVYEWRAEGFKSRKDSLRDFNYATSPSWRRTLAERGRILSTNIRNLPEDIRKLLVPRGILSLLVYPLFMKDTIAGFIGVDECSRTHDWKKSELDLLKTASGIISTVLERSIGPWDGKAPDGPSSGKILDIQGKKYMLTAVADITEQIDLRKRVETQRQRLCNIIHGARLGTWEWNIQTGEAVCNERWAEIAGYTLAELEPVSFATWEDLLHPEDLKESNRHLARHFAGESKYYDLESRMMHKDGHWIWIVARGKVIEWSADGKPVNMFGTLTDITEKKELEERVRQLSIRDCLTEAYNRRYVFDRLEVLAAEYSRLGKNFCISILDIDHFKAVNDRYGHQTGDFVLKDFTSVIDSSIRPYDLLGRYGGEEFIVVSANASGPDTASMIGRIMEIVNRRSFDYNGVKIRCTFSCGIADSAEFAPQELCISKLVDIADRRLYAAKDAGRNRLIGP